MSTQSIEVTRENIASVEGDFLPVGAKATVESGFAERLASVGAAKIVKGSKPQAAATHTTTGRKGDKPKPVNKDVDALPDV